MAIAVLWTGAWSTALGAVTPVAGGAYSIGDCLLYFTGENMGNDVLAFPDATWTLLTPNSGVITQQIYGKIALSTSETIPAVNWGGTNRGYAALMAVSGVETSMSNHILTSERLSSTTQNIVGGSTGRTPDKNGCLNLFIGGRQKTATSNGTTYSAPATWTLGDTFSLVGTATSGVYGYQLQTTATAIANNLSWPGTIADGAAQGMRATAISLGPAVSSDPPVRPPEWPNPVRRPDSTGVHRFWQIPLELRTAPIIALPISNPDWPLVLRKQLPASFLSISENLSESALFGKDRVLTPTDWDYGFPSPSDRLPACFRDESQGFTVNDITALTTFPPYQETNWPVPLAARRLNQSFDFAFPRTLVGKDQILLTGPQNNMWDPPKGKQFPSGLASIEQSGLALYNTVQIKPPLSQSDWPVPQSRRRSVSDFIAGTPSPILALLTSIPPRAFAQDLPLRRRFSSVYTDLAQPAQTLLFPALALPPGSFEQALPRRRARSNVLYQISLRSEFLEPPTPVPPTSPGQVAGPGGRTILMPKKVGETVTRPFDFISRLGASETLLSATVTASVYSGIDLNPSAIIHGGATISGTIVFQSITGGSVGVVYELLCKVVTSLGQVLEMAAFWVVEPDLP